MWIDDQFKDVIVAALAIARDETPETSRQAQFNALLAQLSAPAASGVDTREALAEYAHEAWSGWMKYMFEKGEIQDVNVSDDGKHADHILILPAWAVQRWARQMSTPYADLPESEKESDRQEADKMLAIAQRTPMPALPQALEPSEVVPDEVREAIETGCRYTESTLAFLDYEMNAGGGSEAMAKDIELLKQRVKRFDTALAWMRQRPAAQD